MSLEFVINSCFRKHCHEGLHALEDRSPSRPTGPRGVNGVGQIRRALGRRVARVARALGVVGTAVRQLQVVNAIAELWVVVISSYFTQILGVDAQDTVRKKRRSN